MRIELNERGSRDDLGEIEGGESAVRIYYARKESIVNKR